MGKLIGCAGLIAAAAALLALGQYVPPGGSSGGGGDTSALYVIGATDATLTNSVINPAAYYGADAAPASAGTLDDEFNGSSLNAAWTWVNQGSATATVTKSSVVLSTTGIGSINFNYIYKTAPATPWEVQAKVFAISPTGSWHAGLVIADSTGKLIVWGPETNQNLGVARYSSPTSFSSNGNTMGFWSTGIQTYLRIKDDGTNVTYWCSGDGIAWVQVQQESRTAFFSSGPTRVGLTVDNENSNPIVLSSDWFRRTL